MSNLKTAKKSAILLVAVLLVLLAISFIPFGSNDGSGRVDKGAQSSLIAQLQELNSLPPAVDEKIEPAVKEQVREALFAALTAKKKEEKEKGQRITVVVEAKGDISDEVKGAKGKISKKADSVDKETEFLAVEVAANKVAELAADDDVVRVYPKVTYYTTLDESVPLIKADAFWNSNYKGNGVKVAVLDTGIDKSHPMLAGRVVAERDFSESGNTDDNYGHGTHVAGIIAGTTVSGGKYSGVALEAQLLNAKVIGDNGEGDNVNVIAGIGWAVDNGAKVISMSLGAARPLDTSVDNAIKDAVAKGAVVVVSSGNCGNGCPSIKCGSYRGVTTPGSSQSVISVGAVDKSKSVACFSSGGSISGVGIKPDFVAPGVDIKSSVPGSGYKAMDGTSMAAPHVSGAVALMLSKNPSLKQDDVKRILEKTASDLGDIGKDTSYGFGLIDMAKALVYREGLELSTSLEPQLISGSVQKITVTVYDDVQVNSVKATVTKPNGAKSAEFTFTGSGGNVYTYDYTDTVLMGNYAVDVAVNYGGTSGSSGAGSEGGGEAGSGSSDVSSITVTQTAYFKVTSLTGDFGSVEEINVSQQQFLSQDITANVTFVNTAAVELGFSALLQLLRIDNGLIEANPSQEIRLPAVTVAANSKATAAVSNAFEVGPGNYTLRVLTDYGAGSLVNETNVSVDDDLPPQILNLTPNSELTNDNPLILIAKVSDHSSLSNISLSVVGKKPPCPAGFSCALVVSPPFSVDVNYSVKTISQSARESEVAVTAYTVFSDKYNYKAQLKACDDYGNCALSDGVNFSMKTPTECVGGRDPAFMVIGEENKSVMGTCTALCSGKKLLVAKTYEAKSVFEEVAATNSDLCLSALNKTLSGTPPSSYLERFDAVVWTTGTDLVNIDSNDAAALSDYYNKKGKIVVEGSDVAFRHGSDEFMASVLRVQLKTDLGFTVTSVANMSNLSINVTRQHPVVAGLATPVFFNATLDPFPDAVHAYNGSVELAEWSGLETKGSAIVAYESGDGKQKSLLLPFSIAALSGEHSRTLAENTIEWLLEDSTVDVIPSEIKIIIQSGGGK